MTKARKNEIEKNKIHAEMDESDSDDSLLSPTNPTRGGGLYQPKLVPERDRDSNWDSGGSVDSGLLLSPHLDHDPRSRQSDQHGGTDSDDSDLEVLEVRRSQPVYSASPRSPNNNECNNSNKKIGEKKRGSDSPSAKREEMTFPTTLTENLLALASPKQKFSPSSILASTELLRLIVHETISRAKIEAECEFSLEYDDEDVQEDLMVSGVGGAWDDRPKANVTEKHVLKVAAEILMDFG